MKVAIKKIIKKPDDESVIHHFEKEVTFLSKFDHPNIIKLFDICIDDNFYYIITEYLDGPTLKDLIKNNYNFTEDKIASFTHQVLTALNYIHTNFNMVHRDIKPENLMFTDNLLTTIKVIDFGSAAIVEEKRTEFKAIGTPYYICPEML